MHHLYLIEIQGGTKNVAGTKISGGGVFDKVVTEPEDPTVLGSAIDQMMPMPPKGSKKKRKGKGSDSDSDNDGGKRGGKNNNGKNNKEERKQA